jgi:predicted transcriptional regulator
MSLDPWTCEEDEDVAQASRRMEQNMVRRLLVLDHNGYLVGMVSVTDVAVKGHNERVAGRVLGRVSAVG